MPAKAAISQTTSRHRGGAFFSAPTAALGVRALFKTVLDCLDDPRTPSRLCLMAGSVDGEVLAEPVLRKYVQEQMTMLAERMAGRLSADKEARLLPAEFDPNSLCPSSSPTCRACGEWPWCPTTGLSSNDRSIYS